MEDSFKLLEERVHRAAERLKTLSAEAHSLRADVANEKERARKAEQALAAAAGQQSATAEGTRKAEALEREVSALRREREEIRARVEKLVTLLEQL